MKIIGRGLIAKSLSPYRDRFDDVTVFASGVADSATNDSAEFEREYALLYETLQSCLHDGRRIVYFSSGGAIYGHTDAPRTENTPLFPVIPYGRHKLFCEALIRQSTLQYLIVRLPNLAGAQQNKLQLIPGLVHQALRGEATLFQHATRDLLDVEDFAAILTRLLEVAETSETVIVASGFSISVIDIFEEIQTTLGTKALIEYLPRGDQQHFSIDKLRHLLGDNLHFHPEYYKEVIRKYAKKVAETLP